MACMDRDFAAYLALESQRKFVAAGAGGGDEPGELSFNLANDVDKAILDRALIRGTVEQKANLSRYTTMRIASPTSPSQVNIRWGAVQSSADRHLQPQNSNLDPESNDSLSITILDVTPDYFERSLPASGGITEQTQSIIRVMFEYPNNQLDSDIAAAWACKIERYFSQKRVVSDFPSAIPVPMNEKLLAQKAGITWHVSNRIDFIRRDAAFVGLSLQLAYFYKIADGRRVDSAIFSVSAALIESGPVDYVPPGP